MELDRVRSAQQRVLATAQSAYGFGSESGMSFSVLPQPLRARLERWSDIDGFSEDVRLIHQSHLPQIKVQTKDFRSDGQKDIHLSDTDRKAED